MDNVNSLVADAPVISILTKTIFDDSHITLENSKLIKQGAEARIYHGTYKENGRIAIIKERFKKTYRQVDLDKSLTKKRIKNEVKLLKKASALG